MNESLRIEPPFPVSSNFMMTEDMDVCGVKFKKGDEIIIWLNKINNNPLEWIEPEKFIPERFDPSSPYFLTPSGKKRNPMSFVPFGGGRRICVGKTFSEVVSRIITEALLMSFDFEFANPDHKVKKPKYDLGFSIQKTVMMKINCT